MNARLLSVLLAVLTTSCAVPNPEWKSLDDESKAFLRAAQGNRTKLLFGDESRAAFDALSKEQQRIVLKKDLLEEGEFLYRPKVVKRFRGNSFDKLTVSFIKDTGVDDPGEVDLFEDGELSVALDLYGVDYVPDCLNFVRRKKDLAWREEVWYREFYPRAIGVTANLGGGTTNATESEQVLFGLASLGLFIDWLEVIGLEGGYIYAYSPDSSLDGTTSDDSAWYYGVRVDAKRFADWAKAAWDWVSD